MLSLSIAVTGPKRDYNIAPKDALEAAARGISNIVIRRLRDRNRHTAANRNGLPKSNYYAQAADSVTTAVTNSEAEVQIRQSGIALHWKGGTVRPKPGKKALAIPVDPSVAMIWPSEAGGVSTGGSDDERYHLIWPKGATTAGSRTPRRTTSSGCSFRRRLFRRTRRPCRPSARWAKRRKKKYWTC